MEFTSMTNSGCLGVGRAGGGWVCQQMDYNVQVCDTFLFSHSLFQYYLRQVLLLSCFVSILAIVKFSEVKKVQDNKTLGKK